MQRLSGLAPLLPSYDGFLVDLWGVVHDGTRLYPYALQALQRLRAERKKVVFLSNAPRRASEAAARLKRMGIGPELYHGIVTSGEVAFRQLQRREWPPGASVSGLVFIGAERDRNLLEELDIPETPLDRAGLVLNAGFDDEEMEEDTGRYLPLLQQAAARRLPMLCANPDRRIVKQNGEVLPCAGLLADIYLELGGSVHWIGKPYPAVYDTALALLAPLPTTRILAIGDNLETDIAGAVENGLDSLLITGGLLSSELSLPAGVLPTEAQLEPLLRIHRPTALAPFLAPGPDGAPPAASR